MLRRLVPLVAASVIAVAAVPSAQSGNTMPPVGIFLVANGAEAKIKAEISQDTQSHGMAKSVITQGITKPSFTVRFPGAAAQCVVTDPQPAFVFRFPDMKRMSQMAQADPMAMMEMMNNGDTMMGGSSPKDYTLARLPVDADARVAGSKGMDTFKFESNKKGPLEFDVKVTSALQPGEYAFFMGKGSAPAAIWAFSLKTK